jgi:hypothetical protein
MSQPKPIKRNPAIVEFSKDHHFALLLVWKIAEGKKKSVEPERMADYIVHAFEIEMNPHFLAEEEFLFSKLAADHPLRRKAEKDHKDIRQMIDEMKTNPGEELLNNFSELLKQHFRFEERDLFNLLQEIIPENELREIGEKSGHREHGDVLWKDKFWL